MSASHTDNHTLHYLALGSALTLGTVVLAPYVLPYIGVGDASTTQLLMDNVHDQEHGLARAANELLSHIPAIGPELAKGGLWSTAGAAVSGLGGLLLARFMEKGEDGTESIRWSKVVRTSALITSALIALPALLTGMTVGLSFLASLFVDNQQLSKDILLPLMTSIGAGGMTTQGLDTLKWLDIDGLGGLSGLLPHLVICGGAMIPAATAVSAASGRNTPSPHIPANSLRAHDQRITELLENGRYT